MCLKHFLCFCQRAFSWLAWPGNFQHIGVICVHVAIWSASAHIHIYSGRVYMYIFLLYVSMYLHAYFCGGCILRMYICMYTFIPTGFDRREKIDGLRLRRKHRNLHLPGYTYMCCVRNYIHIHITKEYTCADTYRYPYLHMYRWLFIIMCIWWVNDPAVKDEGGVVKPFSCSFGSALRWVKHPLLGCPCPLCHTWRRVGFLLARADNSLQFRDWASRRVRELFTELLDASEGLVVACGPSVAVGGAPPVAPVGGGACCAPGASRRNSRSGRAESPPSQRGR